MIFKGVSVDVNPVFLIQRTQNKFFCKGQRSTNCNITPNKSQSFCMITFSASLINLILLLPQSRDTSRYVSRPIPAPPPPRPASRNTLIYAHTTLCTLPTGDINIGSLKLLALEAGDFVELVLLYLRAAFEFSIRIRTACSEHVNNNIRRSFLITK
jgi:hypothetical protein